MNIDRNRWTTIETGRNLFQIIVSMAIAWNRWTTIYIYFKWLFNALYNMFVWMSSLFPIKGRTVWDHFRISKPKFEPWSKNVTILYSIFVQEWSFLPNQGSKQFGAISGHRNPSLNLDRNPWRLPGRSFRMILPQLISAYTSSIVTPGSQVSDDLLNFKSKVESYGTISGSWNPTLDLGRKR